jgi:hypothetical protein
MYLFKKLAGLCIPLLYLTKYLHDVCLHSNLVTLEVIYPSNECWENLKNNLRYVN